MNGVLSRLIEVMEDRNVSAKELCDELGISSSTFSTWKSKDREPKPSQIAEAARYLRVSSDYILGLTDDPIDYDENAELVASIPLSYIEGTGGDLSQAYQLMLAAKEDALNESRYKKPGEKEADLVEDQSRANSHPGYIRIPVLGRVAGGVPIEQIEDIEDYEDIKAPVDSKKDYFALRVRGDSMQPLILDGSVVIVRKQSDAETGDIVIATVNGDDATCKRLKKYAAGIMLVSINPAYDPIVLNKDDINNELVRILGKVVEVRTTL